MAQVEQQQIGGRYCFAGRFFGNDVSFIQINKWLRMEFNQFLLDAFYRSYEMSKNNWIIFLKNAEEKKKNKKREGGSIEGEEIKF